LKQKFMQGKHMPSGTIKSALATPIALLYRGFASLSMVWRRLDAFANLRSCLSLPLPGSVVVMGRAYVYGTGRIRCGEDLLLYPGQYLETHGDAEISIGDGVVMSTGVHLVAYAGIRIGKGTMIGEYASIRDANHTRESGRTLRDSDPVARPIVIGKEVWIGRGVAVLSGVTIGDGATVGANAVVTRDVPAGALVVGVPAVPVERRARSLASSPMSRQ
jgi:acetyltransferase-like isoleucine patch superfamily enzyme